jgi:excisionase family DNA binding protein
MVHSKQLKHGTHENKRMLQDYANGDRFVVNVLEEWDCAPPLDYNATYKRERELIDFHDTILSGYNLCYPTAPATPEKILKEGHITIKQYAEKFSLSYAWVHTLIQKGRIPAIKIGNQWAIPADTPTPADNRVKSGNYKDWRQKYPSS